MEFDAESVHAGFMLALCITRTMGHETDLAKAVATLGEVARGNFTLTPSSAESDQPIEGDRRRAIQHDQQIVAQTLLRYWEENLGLSPQF